MSGRASKAKSKERGKGERGVGKLLRKVEEVVSAHNSFRSEWSSKFNDLQERFKKIVMATGQQLAQLSANQQVHSNVLEQLDINTQAVARLGIEMFGRFEQIDFWLKRSGCNVSELEASELEEIKKRARETYEVCMQNCFRLVHEDREAAIKEQREAADRAKQEAAAEAAKAEQAKKEAADKVEAQTAKQILQDAENSRKLTTDAGGVGAEIPAGADVFGG
jgi:hypothetical protein